MNKYDCIINHIHHTSPTRKRMSIHDRAAQFSPFSALTGYDESIHETGRSTSRKIELTEEQVLNINKTLNYLVENPSKIMLTYFIPDRTKCGGKYKTIQTKIKKIKDYEGIVVLDNDLKIKFSNIINIEIKKDN